MRRLAALSLLVLSGCPAPYELEAAGITAVDGGVLLGSAGGGFYLPTGGNNSYRPLRNLPSQETLCMLWIGDYGNRTDYPRTLGTWVDDVTAPWFLGEPARQADFQGSDDVQLAYTYRAPGSVDPSGSDAVSVTLGFEYADVVETGTIFKGQDDYYHGQRINHPYFLSKVLVQGITFLPCWDWRVRNNEDTHWTPCPNCWGGDVNNIRTCDEIDDFEHVDMCFR